MGTEKLSTEDQADRHMDIVERIKGIMSETGADEEELMSALLKVNTLAWHDASDRKVKRICNKKIAILDKAFASFAILKDKTG